MWHYYIEITDTFGGEANYAWVRRYRVRSKSMLGAARVVSRHRGWQGRLRLNADYGDQRVYDITAAAIRFFIEPAEDHHAHVPFLN